MAHKFTLDRAPSTVGEDFGASSGTSSKNQHITPEMIKAALRSVSLSETFRRSRRLQELLSFLVERAMDSPGTPVSAQLIAAKVFKRGHDFNSGEDPIVRTSLCRLRVALAAHYQSPQCKDILQFKLHQREYVLEFIMREKKTFFREYGNLLVPVSVFISAFAAMLIVLASISNSCGI